MTEVFFPGCRRGVTFSHSYSKLRRLCSLAFYIPEEKISEIQNVADITDIVSESVLLKKAGKNHIGLCPFHSEKTPSFTVNPEKQIFHCFGCGAGGNVISFVMKHDGVSFPEAVQSLAKRFNIELPTRDMSLAEQKAMGEREQILEVNQHAMKFYQNMLFQEFSGKPGLQYLTERGITKNTLEKFYIGYVPDGWNNLVQHLARKRISRNVMIKSGLVIENNQKTGYYDRFRNRIIFPIFSTGNQVIGFGGRVLDDSLPKYLNSPETLVYSKSSSLYGLHIAKPECRKTGTAFIVEGYMDLLALWQYGIHNAVATLGTSLTSEHVRILRGHCGHSGKVILVYDSDEAGLKAAARSIEIFDKEHLDAAIMVLPNGHDPDSYLFEYGEAEFRGMVKHALSAMDFLMESAVLKHGMSVEGKVRTVAIMKDYLANASDHVLRSLYIKKLAEKLNIDDSAIMEKVREAIQKKRTGNDRAGIIYGKNQQSTSRNEAGILFEYDRMEKKIIAMMVQYPEILPEICKQNILSCFENKVLAKIGVLILEQHEKGNRSVSSLIVRVNNPEQEKFIASLAIENSKWNHAGCLKLIKQFVLSKNKRNHDLLMRIKTAEAQNDDKLLIALMEQLRDQKKIQKKRESAGGKTL
ncbi:MAG: DNA primase [Desulfobacterium sp.]|nr:DNA primase [Desulfobacterium sp.]